MGYRLGYSGPEVDVLLQKAYKYSVINNGWAKLDSSDSNPVDLNSLVTQGNYSISFWNNGPVQLNTSGPINICVTKDSSNGKTYQTIYDAGKVYLRETTGTSFSNTWIEEQNNTDLDINASVPQNPQDNYVWIDTSGEEPTIKVYKESTHSWVPVSAADLAKASVYDPQGINQPIDEYLDQKIADADLSKAEQDYNAHLIEGESSGNPIHVTTEEKTKWNSGISKDDASTIVNALKTEMTSYANQEINTSIQEVSDISDKVNKISSNIDVHIADGSIHLTTDDVTSFDNKAAGDHKHLNDGHVTVSAANITGMIAVERLDPSVLERNYTVTSYEEMMALTKNEIQNGDSVFINGTQQSAWFVVDDTQLGVPTININLTTISTVSTTRNWTPVCYGNGIFVTMAYGSNRFAYSTDGINWTESVLPYGGYMYSICYGGGKFVAIAQYTNYFVYSTDGINWDVSEYVDSVSYECVCYGNGVYVAITYDETYFVYSTDGINWNHSNKITSRQWISVCYENNMFTAVACNSNAFAYSTDGINWTEGIISSTSRKWGTICYGNGMYIIIVRSSSYYAYSADGITWTETTTPNSISWMDICYCCNKFVAISKDTVKYTYSTDGLNWVNGTFTSSTISWNHICSDNISKCVVVGYKNNAGCIEFSSGAFVQYAAPAKELTWENITNKPSTLAEYNITTSYTKDEINTLYNNILASINEVKNKADEYNEAIGTEIPSNLDETIATNTTSANDLNSKVDLLIKNAI